MLEWGIVELHFQTCKKPSIYDTFILIIPSAKFLNSDESSWIPFYVFDVYLQLCFLHLSLHCWFWFTNTFELPGPFSNANLNRYHSQRISIRPAVESKTRLVSVSKKKMASKVSDQHCCVPLCAGNGRKNPKLAFHKIPPKPKAKQVWIQAIRRDPGPYFKVSLQLYRPGLLHPQAIWTLINDGHKFVVIKSVYLYILVVHIKVWSTE